MAGKSSSKQTEIRAQHNLFGDTPAELDLQLRVTDQEVIQELLQREPGADRDHFATSALRVGVLAFRQASGLIDRTAMRSEGERLVGEIRSAMVKHVDDTKTHVAEFLKRYFDPKDGDLPQRLERLVKHDGEMATLLKRHLATGDSTLARTLTEHIGLDSPIFKLLSPKQSDGLLAELRKTLEQSLTEQSEHVIKQFSLDDKESALSRLVEQITNKNGELRIELAKDMEKVRKELSLDDENSALSRLVGRVDKAQQMITRELSLDVENSALSRINKKMTEFQTEMRATLESLVATRKAEARTTTGGLKFEDALGEWLMIQTQGMGDIYQHTGNTSGSIPRSKKGDFVVTLGSESRAPGERIVFEAKDHHGYDLNGALVEMEEARKNRKAKVGVFVFSKETAPDGLDPFLRFDNDIVVIWDQDDVSTDIGLKAALSSARAIMVRQRDVSDAATADMDALDGAIDMVSKGVADLTQIKTWANTIKNNSEHILQQADKITRRIEEGLDTMQSQTSNLRSHL